MFTPAERRELRDRLVATAEADPAVSGAALVGSAAGAREDRWSDIDLALCLDPAADATAVVEEWTGRMYGEHAAVSHLDVRAGSTLFRVFLLPSTLQVDLSFWEADGFGATGPDFRLLFGSAREPSRLAPPAVGELVGWGWLYALHARSSIARGRLWQAEYMVSGLRDQVVALACRRHGLPAARGRGVDELPAAVREPLAEALVRSLTAAELGRAFAAGAAALAREAELADPELAARLAGPLRELTETAARPRGRNPHA
ncbi:hypothetical protein RM844_30745 [Streptomyces sp. DSM 44915]|uniref:Nucleotidyltransferase domain-containing protein n=1 Tax=Streptomyces chisholmiae TaxID=3075540 RepID=A0ABU2K098_9ACTN|nr:hypothetical protein [Streptomyces sp. DSM 44915]MDT0270659.1 hypothetical protein [Streptomyces sp. DSM 44915]